jgi:putative DNA primase/helicase
MGQKGFTKKKSGSWRWEGVGLKSAGTASTSSVFG